MANTFPLPVFQPGAPLYDQLYRHIAAAIQSGALPPGTKLPSKRRLCALAGVSMSTVETAYALLAAEGYVRTVPRSGYLVADLLPMGAAPLDAGDADACPGGPEPPADAPLSPPAFLYDCSTSAVDTSVFPFSSWARITKEAV